MKVYIFTVVLILAMISALHCIPIEVVYTGDSCDCPKALRYIVNAPPPRETKEYTRGEHGYKLDVPVQAKTKVTYSFDFTVEEPKPPSPVEEEKWKLFAKIDRITAHRKDCLAPRHRSCGSSSCNCDRCAGPRNSRYRYVSPVVKRAFFRRRCSQQFDHPNSLSKNERRKPFRTLAWAAVIPFNDKSTVEGTPMLKSRRKRGLSTLLGLNRKPQNVKRPERLVKQYHKSLQVPLTTTTKPIMPKLGEYLKTMPKLSDIGFAGGRRPFANFRNLILPPLLRHRRDIKGEYDLLEKERQELDLTLPEIIQFMPETLDPNFKRGQCQFGCPSRQSQEETLQSEESNKLSDETTNNSVNSLSTEGTTEQTDTTTDTNDSDDDDNNDVSSPPTKRHVEHYGCGHIHPFDSPPPPYPGYSLEPHSHTADNIPRPFAISDSPYIYDPVPQQYVGAPQVNSNTAPVHAASPRSMYDDEQYYVGGSIYNPTSPGYYANPELDRIIAEIIGQHGDFIEATTHEGGALVDPSNVQKHNTKSFFRSLLDSRWHKWFQDDVSQEHDHHMYAFVHPPHAYQQYSPAYGHPPYR